MQKAVSYRDISSIALPIMISGISIHMIGLIDTVFLARLGEVELGAAGNSTLLYYTMVVCLSGLSLGAQIIMARRNGEKSFQAIGKVFQTSMWLMLILTFIAFLLLHFGTSALVNAIYNSSGVIAATEEFMSIRTFGLFPAVINFVFIAFYVGITKTRVLAIGTPLLAIVNIALDYFLIFGIGPFPEMGLKGAALASVIAECFGSLFFIGYMIFYTDIRKYGLNILHKFDADVLKRIWKIGSPLMLQYLVAMAAWFVFFSIIERINERALAVSHIVRALYMILGIPLTAWSDATNTLVSNLIGQNKQEMIMPTIKKIALLLLLVDGIYCVLINIFPDQILGLFTTDITLINDAIPTLRVISFSLTFFSLSFLSFRGLAGAGLTNLCMRIEMFTVVVYLCAAFALVTWFDASTALVWCTEFIYFGLLGGISFYFLRQGKYNTDDF
jgi:putative MATE family efflux protein